MAILQFKNADGNWESFVDYDLLTQIKAGVDELLERPAGGSSNIIEPGIYTFKSSPDVSHTAASGSASDYLFSDILLYNSTTLSFNYGLVINNGTMGVLTAPQSITSTLNSNNIYTNGAFTNNNVKQYRVPIATKVNPAFYAWWEANTTKSVF